ncbi:hypothetical protein [Subtercola vilae]|uniref:Uncharacterized protein n=1 Tax=Subtercola vilae TaxID=2056433 RepID=A0A4T2BSC5_9MICO|nr:hypothetical protein [Subtercola vilae]TIH32258.1 hypothetical protein D4765_15880 [Subtercola vilae]
MVDPNLVEVALERVQGTIFETFTNEFFPPLLGADYSPLGGMHDGGADGFGGDIVHERLGRAGVFYQASVQKDSKAKIRSTIARLRDVGRKPTALTYFTSQTVPFIDVLEDELGQELGVVIRIKDGSYIRAHVNDHQGLIAAFERHLLPLTTFLSKVGAATLISASRHVSSPAVFVFLRQEVDKMDGDLSLVNAITDSLALWALEGTDPDAGIMMGSDEVTAKVTEVLPSARSIVSRRMQKRLEALSSKNYPGGRQANFHRNDNKFVLPWETRRRITGENQDDEALRIRVLRSFEDRTSAQYPDFEPQMVDLVANVVLRAMQFSFEQQGLEFAHFMSSEGNVEYPQMADAVRDALAANNVSGDLSVQVAAASLEVARRCIYSGNHDEREYLGRLARTYSLLFTLNHEPRLVEYFEQMASDFYLYVGTDMILRALSERYLPVESQMCRNMLLMAAQGNVKLVLTEPVLDEVLAHLRASDREFNNFYVGVEHRMTPEMVREIPKLLVRAYFYNRSEEGGPRNWPAFVDQFCTHRELFRGPAIEELQRYLMASFHMEYRSRSDLEKLADPVSVKKIKDQLVSAKTDERLAENDALLASAVYGHRHREGESSNISAFGYKTWWLTNETTILRFTKLLELRNNGARYMMRPDFLLNFFSFAPSTLEVRRTFANVFPSTLGVQLSRRMDEKAFHKIMDEVKAAEGFEEGRRLAVMASCADKLKGDFERRYITGGSFDPDVPARSVT